MSVKRVLLSSLRPGAILAVAAAAWLPAPAAQAQEAQTGPSSGRANELAVRVYYLGDHFSYTEAASTGGTFTTVTYRGRPGGGLDVEYRPVDWLGLDLAASQTHIAADEQAVGGGPPVRRQGNIEVRPFTLGVFARYLPWRQLALYIGPIAGAVEMSGSFRPASTRFAFGSAAGLDVGLGSTGLAVSGVVRLISSRFDDQLRNASHYRSQFLYGGGLSYRF
jgi:hypothetical protein